ncbi:MAG: hypothetical protein ABIP48_11530, partial [Planctomycetota bacterium]
MHSPTMRFVAWGLMCSWCLATLRASEQERPHEWPQLKGDSGFTGLSPDDTVKPPLKLVWSYRLDGDASGDAGAGVIVAGWADWVWCLDLKSGKPIWRSFIPVSIEAVSYYRDRLWVRSPYYVVELDPTEGTWLRIAEASYGYGGMAFVGDRLFQSGLLGQYGTTGATSISSDAKGGPPPESMLPTLKGVSMLSPQPLEGGSELASMAAPLALGDKVCFVTLEGNVILTKLDGTQ